MTATKAKPGPKPKHGQTMTNTERVHAYRERKREEERQRLAAEEAERLRQAEERRRSALLRVDCRRAVGRLLDTLPRNGYRIISTLEAAGWTEANLPEAKRYIDEIISALIHGETRLP